MRIPNVVKDLRPHWRLICHSCGHKYPAGTAVSTTNADCCKKPKLHLHNTDFPCDRCSGE